MDHGSSSRQGGEFGVYLEYPDGLGKNTSSATKPEIIVFAGPNGSGKSTSSYLVKIIESFINADGIKRSNQCSDVDVAMQAEKMCEDLLAASKSFTSVMCKTIIQCLSRSSKKKQKDQHQFWENKFWTKK